MNAYRVKYFVPSRCFAKYVPPGTLIPLEKPHMMALESIPSSPVEIPLGLFGSSSKSKLIAESLVLHAQALVLILLWVPDRQEKLWH
jgi:hypothetical protein